MDLRGSFAAGLDDLVPLEKIHDLTATRCRSFGPAASGGLLSRTSHQPIGDLQPLHDRPEPDQLCLDHQGKRGVEPGLM